MVAKCTFGKAERLCSHKVIEALFAGGNKSLSAYPVRAVYMPEMRSSDSLDNGSTEAGPARIQVLISVSKRHFKHAVDRNRVKRQIREAYRLNKQTLLSALPDQMQLSLAFIWLSDEHFDTKVVEEKIKKLLMRLADNLDAKQSSTEL